MKFKKYDFFYCFFRKKNKDKMDFKGKYVNKILF